MAVKADAVCMLCRIIRQRLIALAECNCTYAIAQFLLRPIDGVKSGRRLRAVPHDSLAPHWSRRILRGEGRRPFWVVHNA